MKIEALHLLAFGPFTDRVLDFSATPSGLQMIYGPNEAGKSSALRAIDALLFGIPPRTTDNFVHAYGELQVGATIVNAAGRHLEFVRRKKQRKSLAKLGDVAATLPENVLDDFLRGIQRDTFQRIYCINHEEFREGGERMRHLNGLMGESLFATSLGGAGLANVLQEFDDAAKELGKRSGKIRTGIAQYQSAKQSKSTHEVSGKKWQALREEYETVLAKKEAVVDRQTELETQQKRLERLRDALPKIAEWRRLEEELRGEEALILPSSYSAEDRARCETLLAEAREQLRQLSTQKQETERILDELEEAPALLRFSEEIDLLQQRYGHQLELREQYRTSGIASQRTAARVQTLLDELESDVSVEQAISLRLRREHRAAIHDLATQQDVMAAESKRLAKQKVDAASEHAALLTSLADQRSGGDVRSLEIALVEVRKHGPLEEELTTAQAAMTELGRQADAELATLPSWNQDLASLVRLASPSRESVQEFQDKYGDLRRASEGLRSQRLERQVALSDIREAIEALLGAGAVCSEEELLSARAERDAAWQEIVHGSDSREIALDDTDAGQRLTAFNDLVQHCDQVADRLRRETDRVASLAHDRARESRLQQDVSRLVEDEEAVKQSLLSLDDAWEALWQGTGVAPLLGPDETIPWLERRATLVRIAGEMAHFQELINRKQAERKQCVDRLATILTEAEVRYAETASLATMLSIAEKQLEQSQREVADHRQLVLAKEGLESQLRKLDSSMQHQQEQVANWEQRWQQATDWIGLTSAASASQAIERVRCLDELGEVQQEWQRQRQLMDDVEKDRQQFEADVADLVLRAAVDLKDLPAQDAVKSLKARLETSQRTHQSVEYQSNRRTELRTAYDALEAKCEGFERQLAHYLALAGVASSDDLSRVESLSKRAARRRDLEAELDELRGHQDLADFVAQADGADAAMLEARMAQLERAIHEEDALRDSIVEELTKVRAARDEVDGNDAAALADQQAMSHLAQVHVDAGQYARVRIAAHMLRCQIERYREENQDPLLAKASDHFSRMTLGEFGSLKADFDDQGTPIIVGVRGNQVELSIDAMSDGTLDPLYLSLRLAYLQRRLEQYEPMPFIVDDILIHLDDERALATMQVLADLAKQTQVLFFTHHARLRELAESALSDDALTVHELSRHELTST